MELNSLPLDDQESMIAPEDRNNSQNHTKIRSDLQSSKSRGGGILHTKDSGIVAAANFVQDGGW